VVRGEQLPDRDRQSRTPGPPPFATHLSCGERL
jgi:hypothetical protein